MVDGEKWGVAANLTTSQELLHYICIPATFTEQQQHLNSTLRLAPSWWTHVSPYSIQMRMVTSHVSPLFNLGHLYQLYKFCFHI